MGFDRQKAMKYVRVAQWGLYARNKVRMARQLKDFTISTAQRATFVKGEVDRLICDGPGIEDLQRVQSIGASYLKSRAEKVAVRAVRKVGREARNTRNR